jgi:multidrug transporter EmrE-like cation transporter
VGDLRGFTPGRLAGIAVSGALATGLSLVLFIRGLRSLGVLQTGTLFALAPGFAALLSLVLLGERADAPRVAALVLMTGGALLLSRDRHEHFHAHEEIEHAHEHDAHHRHAHGPGEAAASPHTHPHRHPPLAHSHPHVHDAHHRHRHG